jgi:phenylalanyl-tRNA synthetase alpha chain
MKFIMIDYKEILEQVKNKLTDANLTEITHTIKPFYLSKEGLISDLMKKLQTMSVEEKKLYGKEVNNLKQEILDLIDEKQQKLKQQEIEQKLISESINIHLPPYYCESGMMHPISKTIGELNDIFTSLGFSYNDGPEIEDDYHNFTALNVLENHPARQMQDTFYLNDGKLLRTQTTAVDIRAIKKIKTPPLYIFSIGKVYRNDSDATHSPMFHQFEMCAIDEHLTMKDLYYYIKKVLDSFFESDIKIRFRPSFFPFTEPSAEVDIAYSIDRNGRIIFNEKGDKWLEILGSGMLRRQVLQNCEIDWNKHNGIAFGGGVDRLAMLKYGYNDIRRFFCGDIEWLKKNGFKLWVI